ncbi:hypothetical protein [Gimesia fumaroli]|uniref:Uncharacterized protein n=1 Tax=Gimesia fumaroli TaxID=2527976 RepID=A0A518IJR3_9PLAN|nr:hypothetical protein [Gimesia fumaroli]QDV53341.1 hypothetical protein Enr17x_54150 [Gimesia fumaroli]
MLTEYSNDEISILIPDDCHASPSPGPTVYHFYRHDFETEKTSIDISICMFQSDSSKKLESAREYFRQNIPFDMAEKHQGISNILPNTEEISGIEMFDEEVKFMGYIWNLFLEYPDQRHVELYLRSSEPFERDEKFWQEIISSFKVKSWDFEVPELPELPPREKTIVTPEQIHELQQSLPQEVQYLTDSIVTLLDLHEEIVYEESFDILLEYDFEPLYRIVRQQVDVLSVPDAIEIIKSHGIQLKSWHDRHEESLFAGPVEIIAIQFESPLHLLRD